MVHFKVAFGSGIENATEGSSEGTPKVVIWDLYKDAQEGAFEVQIKRAFRVRIELRLKMHMVIHLSGHKSAQNDSVKKWTWVDTLYCT